MKDDRPVLVGMNNPYGVDPRYALYPLPERATGWRIWQLLRLAAGDVGMREYRDAFDRRNLLVGPWVDQEAEPAARDMREKLRGRTVVLLGAKVRDAFWMGTTPCGSTNRLEIDPFLSTFTYFHWVPHPSGRCQFYNNEENRLRVGTLLARLYAGERGQLTV